MQQVAIEQVPAELEHLIERALQGEEVVITQADEPVLKLVRIPPQKTQISRQPGNARGLISYPDDFDQPGDDDQLDFVSELRALRDRIRQDRGDQRIDVTTLLYDMRADRDDELTGLC